VPTHVRMLVVLGASASLAAAVLAVAGPGAAAPLSTSDLARQRLTAEVSTGNAVVRRGANGDVTFVGTPAGAEIDNPAVTASTPVAVAARAHLARYGAALGASRPGTTLVQRNVTADVAGGDVVHYTQRVGGLPVIGGDVVVTMNADREMVSMSSTMSTATQVRAARVSESDAADVARVVAANDAQAGSKVRPIVTSEGRWVLDRAVTGTPAPGVATVWRFDVMSGVAHREILVDDQTGALLLDMDADQTFLEPGDDERSVGESSTSTQRVAGSALAASSVNRVVCDNAEDKVDYYVLGDVPCTTDSSPARVEGELAANNDDVDAAYDNAGATSDLYASLGVDLTQLIGREMGDGTKALAQTVRMCYHIDNPLSESDYVYDWCPYENARWNGTQMYYGTGFALADDIVGHEMTHGVTQHYSNLFYWGESGAINESMSDVMGEIVDHRHLADGESVDSWVLGEDLPGAEGGSRSLADPSAFWDPDRMSSGYWQGDDLWQGNGGVHTNSGVGNKTAYLIMRGGTFNGQTITGIDGDDQSFAKTARLYLLTNQSLPSGADYRGLSQVLQQSCRTLSAVANSGFTQADCEGVRKATVATELDQTPAKSAKPADAPSTCPPALPIRTVLFDSETGDSDAKFTHAADSNWSRATHPVLGQNARSGRSSWHNVQDFDFADELPGTDSLVMAQPLTVPAAGRTYLRFSGWHQFVAPASHTAQPRTYDAGTVEVDDVGDPAPPLDAAELPWVNGPAHRIVSGGAAPWDDPENTAPIDNPLVGRMGFGGVSLGWVASSVDLTSFAGRSVRPQFTSSYDNAVRYLGWFVDDITVYHCTAATAPIAATPPPKAGTVRVRGKAKLGKRVTAATAGWVGGTTYSYQWQRDGKDIKRATKASYLIRKSDAGHRLKVVVTGTTGAGVATATSSAIRVPRHR